ncbi:hypothetical protein BDW69DRAFT_187215 [Aspergillus filifer]
MIIRGRDGKVLQSFPCQKGRMQGCTSDPLTEQVALTWFLDESELPEDLQDPRRNMVPRVFTIVRTFSYNSDTDGGTLSDTMVVMHDDTMGECEALHPFTMAAIAHDPTLMPVHSSAGTILRRQLIQDTRRALHDTLQDVVEWFFDSTSAVLGGCYTLGTMKPLKIPRAWTAVSSNPGDARRIRPQGQELR